MGDDDARDAEYGAADASRMAATFPLLDLKELIGVLNDIGAGPIQLDDLVNPTPAKVLPLYAWFLDSLGQLTLDDVMVTAQLQLDTYDNQDVFREVVYTGTLHAVLDQIMKWAALDDFSPVDIRMPTRERMRRIFSALSNFYLYEQDQVKLLEDLEEGAEALSKTEHEHERRHAELQDALDKRKTLLQQRATEASHLETANASSREELIRTKDASTELSEAIEADRQEKLRLQEDMESVLRAVTEFETDITKFRGRLVRSPDRVRANVQSLEERIAQLRVTITEQERKVQDHKDRVHVLRKYETDITGLLRAVDDWETETDRADEEAARLQRQTDERDARKEELNELDFRTSTVDKRLTSLVEQKDRQAASAQEKRDGVRRRMERVETTHQALMKDQAVADAQSSKKQKAIQVKEKQIADLAKEAQAELARGEAAYLELKAEVESYVIKLERSLDNLNTFNAVS